MLPRFNLCRRSYIYISLFIIPYPVNFVNPSLVWRAGLTYWQKSYPLYLYFPFYYTTNYSICQYGCELRYDIFIKILEFLLEKLTFIIPQIIVFINIVAVLKLIRRWNPRFVDKTRIFSTLFYWHFHNNSHLYIIIFKRLTSIN